MADVGGDAVTLRVEGLTVVRGGVTLLDGVGLEAPAGRTTAVLGPSGAGKSTLLRAIAGLEVPERGRVVLGVGGGAQDVTRVPAHRRGIGLMFQDQALFPHRNVADNVSFGLEMAGREQRGDRGDRRDRVGEVLALVGLEGFGARKVGSLSGGEAQRVALARALAPSPPVLCLDEPLRALDRVLHDRLVVELRELFASLSTTVVHVTHDQHEALALADHLVVMARGGVVQAGDPTSVWQRPATVEVARFLGQEVVLDRAAAAELGLTHADPDWQRAAMGAGHVVVRPDALRLVGPPLGEGPCVSGRVTDVVFGGDRTLVHVDTVGLGPVVVPCGLGDRPRVGEAVVVQVDPAGTWPVS
jgi:thiamine transport system ATP-binding protein